MKPFLSALAAISLLVSVSASAQPTPAKPAAPRIAGAEQRPRQRNPLQPCQPQVAGLGRFG